RRRDLPQRVVLRAGPCLQRHQGVRAAAGLCVGASALPRGARVSAAARARRRAAFPAHAAGRLAQRAARRAGAAEGSARIFPQAALSPGGRERARLRDRRMNEAPKHHVKIYTDGGCAPNPGPGGWAAILLMGAHEKELKGGEPTSTNNRMELTAAISGLEALKWPCVVDMHTDSQYVRDGITKYVRNWKRNGWRTSSK